MASTIKDVARLAGVGVGTASRVISGKGPVAPETAARVQQAIDTLGFRPSSIARALSRQSLDMLGVYVPAYQGLFYGPVLETIDRELREVDRHMVAANGCACGDARTQALDGLEFLRARECDGLLLMSHELTDDDIRELHAHTPQIAVLNRIVPGLERLCFSSDHELGGRLAAQCLLEAGHRRIAILSGPHHAPDNEARLRGFLDTLGQAEVTVPEDWIVEGDFITDTGRVAAEMLLARFGTRLPFTALFCANDPMAIAAIGAFSRAGVRVPEDLSVIGYDDCDFAAHVSPPLTTVRIDIGAVAAQAARDLINRCYGLDLAVAHDFPPELVRRASVCPPAPTPPDTTETSPSWSRPDARDATPPCPSASSAAATSFLPI
ncbi:MAG: LacI family transcriptional regulator [Pseudomonadota bacterium]|nr:LacI family transcriptional regulator [Pseudomonadota bacterium]